MQILINYVVNNKFAIDIFGYFCYNKYKLYILLLKGGGYMRTKINNLASALVITAATALILTYCYFFPDDAQRALIIYISS